MELPKNVILLDSLGDLQISNTSPILVCGSHCGGNRELAQHVMNCNIQAVFLNNAGVGKNQAGTKGLSHYEAENILACAVDHNSAEIGIALDTLESGIISHTTTLAKEIGIQIGDSVKLAITKLTDITEQTSSIKNSEKEKKEDNNKQDLKQQIQTSINGVNITVTDSVTFLNKDNYGDIVVCGSHGGLSAGEYAQKYKLKAVFFNDAGIGKNNAGTKSLEILSKAGILACTVDCMSAEIFNGEDVLNNGVISVCNQLAESKNIKTKISVKEAITNI